MREWVLATKEILNSWQEGRRVDFRGNYTRHTLNTPAFTPPPNPYGIPKVLVGALGPRMNEMAAEVADGNLIMPFNSDRHMRERTMPAIESGLAKAGRARGDVEITAEVIIAVGRNDEELSQAMAAKSTVAFYGSTPAYRPVLEVEGYDDLQPELNARSKRGDWAGMTGLIDDELFGRIAIVGSPTECAAEIVQRFGNCDRISAYFPGYKISDDLVRDVVDALRAA
jgi:probable F420-dependent oxidoreductase